MHKSLAQSFGGGLYVLRSVHLLQMNAYFTLNNLFYEKQYGFRKYHSTELAALNVVDTIVNHMDNGNTPFAVYLDLSKVSDLLI